MTLYSVMSKSMYHFLSVGVMVVIINFPYIITHTLFWHSDSPLWHYDDTLQKDACFQILICCSVLHAFDPD